MAKFYDLYQLTPNTRKIIEMGEKSVNKPTHPPEPYKSRMGLERGSVKPENKREITLYHVLFTSSSVAKDFFL